jgi:hypothetical protein
MLHVNGGYKYARESNSVRTYSDTAFFWVVNVVKQGASWLLTREHGKRAAKPAALPLAAPHCTPSSSFLDRINITNSFRF